MQSPIDIRGAKEPPEPQPRLELAYQNFVPELEHNRWTIQIDCPEGSTLKLGDNFYDLVQFHFHEPSEHYIEGRRFALEAHFVHKHRGADDQLAVLAVMIDSGNANPLFSQISSCLPEKQGDKTRLEEIIKPSALLPKNLDYYRLLGSLTVEPYSENVLWLILTDPMTASPEQIEDFHQSLHDNARPLQPRNNRDIFICRGCL